MLPKNSTFNNVNTLLVLSFSLLFILIGLSCKKIIEEQIPPINPAQTLSLERNPDANCDLTTTICEDYFF